MNPEQLSRRRFVNATALALSTVGLPACGGGGSGTGTPEAVADNPTKNVPTNVAAPPVPPAPTVVVTRLSVHSSADGSRNYASSVFPLEGQVPAGQTLVSPDDATAVCSVLSHWNDGSAAVMVVAGTTAAAKGETAVVRLQLGTPVTALPVLTAASVGKSVNAVKVDFGVLGVAQLTDFSSPERIWWANAKVICARYRLRAPGHSTLEALVDIHAYAGGRALVEIVVENARMVTAAPVKPADAAYDGVAYVNGVAAGSARSSEAPEGTHTAFRAWYASAWVGGDPGLFTTQLHTDLQKHPVLFRVDQPGGDMSEYAADTYVPWTAARMRAVYMGGAGDHPEIGPITLWDAHFLQSGSPLAARAVETNALAVLSYNVSYRDTNTGLVPDAAQLVGYDQQSNWPKTTNPTDLRTWEVAHHPAAGLLAFACRPSPIYIEVAQRIVVWNSTWSAGGMGSPNMSYWTDTGITDSTGVYGYFYQPRGRAWCLRSLVHATFLSPDGSWREGGKRWLNLNRIYWQAWMKKQPAIALGVPWAVGPNNLDGLPANNWQWPSWQTHFLIPELHKAAAVKLLQGVEQTALETVADWVASFPVRWVNEQPNGGWRYIPYQQLFPTDSSGKLPTNWADCMAKLVSAPPPSVAGTWFMRDGDSADYVHFFGEGVAGGGSTGYYYISAWWAAFAAAVERGIPGSEAAWNTVNANLTNLETWRKGFGANPRFGAAPRRVGGKAI